jgi:FkbM family methyltransferase
MRFREIVGRLLRRADLKLVPYGETYVARRDRLIRTTGVETILDIGANAGQYGHLLRHYGYRGRIVSFEPLAEPFGRLKRRAAGDPGWAVERRAIGRASGPVTINVSRDSVYSSVLDLDRSAAAWNPASEYVGAETVEAESIDDVVARLGLDRARLGLKIDVQGFEADVLAGAAETMDVVPYLEIELSGRPLYEGQMLLPGMLAATAAVGLTPVVIETLRPDPATGYAMQFDGIFVRI